MFCRMDTEFEFDVTKIFDVVDFDCFSLHRIAFSTWPLSNYFMRYVSLGEETKNVLRKLMGNPF